MEVVLNRLYHLYTWKYFWLSVIVAASLAMHFLIVNSPNQPIFDEMFYVPDARNILAGHGEIRYEHPPLGQLLITLSMLIFGDNPLGWRFLSIIFGAIVLVLFYLVVRRLGMSDRITSLAVFLLAFENLNFIQSGVAMFDVFTFTFMLLAFWLYLRGNYLLTTVAVGIGTLTKLTGALAVPVIGLHWLLLRRDHPVRFLLSMVIAPVIFIEFLVLFDYIMLGYLYAPITRIKLMLSQSASCTYSYANPENASRPWQWVLQPRGIYYWYLPHYMGFPNHTVWALNIPSAVYMFYRAIRRHSASLFGILWFASTYIIWLPVSFFMDRITYAFYVYPAVASVIVGVCLGISQLIAWSRERGKTKMAVVIISLYLVLHLAAFLFLAPFIDQTFMFIPLVVIYQ